MKDQLLPLQKYRELMDLSPLCTVDVLFFDPQRTRTLLFKRTNDPLKGTYFSIGGRLLKGEAIEDCAVRQSKRELGIPLVREKLVSGGFQVEMHPNSVFDGVPYHAIDFFFGYILADEPITMDFQHSDSRWFDTDDASLHPFIRTKVDRLLEAYGQER